MVIVAGHNTVDPERRIADLVAGAPSAQRPTGVGPPDGSDEDLPPTKRS